MNIIYRTGEYALMLKKIFNYKFSESQLQLIFFIAFICLGAIYANLVVSKSMDDYSLIYDFFGNRIKEQSIVKTDLFEYLLLSRIKLLVALWVIGFILFAFYIDLSITCFFGFNFGLILSSSLLYNGFIGYGLIITLFFPHALIYVPVYIYLIIKNTEFSKALYRNRKTSKSFKINSQLLFEYFLALIISGVFVIIGVTFESYINPDIIKWYMSITSA